MCPPVQAVSTGSVPSTKPQARRRSGSPGPAVGGWRGCSRRGLSVLCWRDVAHATVAGAAGEATSDAGPRRDRLHGMCSRAAAWRSGGEERGVGVRGGAGRAGWLVRRVGIGHGCRVAGGALEPRRRRGAGGRSGCRRATSAVAGLDGTEAARARRPLPGRRRSIWKICVHWRPMGWAAP